MTVVAELVEPWIAINAALGLSTPVRDAAHYAQLLAFVDECFERFGGQEGHPIFSLVELVTSHIREYEDKLNAWPDASTPASRVAFLMEQHGLRQCNLPEVGAQSVVSAVLSGKRKLNLRQAHALSKRFGVDVGLFIG